MPDKRENIKSRYTADRAIPGAFEGETVTRRRFMVGTTHLAGAGAALAFTLPALAFALGPVFERQKATWEDVGPESAFNPDTYVPVNFTNIPGIGDVGRTTAYVRRFNPALDGSSQHKGEAIQPYVAISTRCAHLGCPVRYVPAAERFICPCHGGVYDKLGKVNGGPPQRPQEGNGKKTLKDKLIHDVTEAGTTVVDWVDERTSLSGATRWALFRKVPKGTNWFYTL